MYSGCIILHFKKIQIFGTKIVDLSEILHDTLPGQCYCGCQRHAVILTFNKIACIFDFLISDCFTFPNSGFNLILNLIRDI